MPHDLATLLKTRGATLHALLTRLTLRPDLAEELMQELFLKLHRSSAFQRAANPSAYAYRAAIHIALDARRRRKEFCELPASLQAPDSPSIDGLIAAENANRLLAAVSELSPQAREAAVLHFIEQKSYEETAAILGNTPHQVRGLCHDALRQLREKFHIAQEQSND